MEKGLFTGGGYDIPAKGCRILIKKFPSYDSKHQTIRLTK